MQLESALTGSKQVESASSQQENLWIEAARTGDQLAFNRLVLKWEKKVYNIAYRMLHQPEEAAEASQEIFLLVFRNLKRFRSHAKFSTWLYRIAVNHCISRLRNRPPVQQSLDEDQGILDNKLGTRPNQEQEVLRKQRRAHILGSLEKLSAEQRAVVELKFFQEQTFEEMADVLGTPLSTVKSRFYTALDVLKRRLGYLTESGL